MAWWVIGLMMFAGLLVLLVYGIPVAFALVSVAVVAALFLWGPSGWFTLTSNSFSSLANYLLLAAPLFILMGICVESSGLGTDAFRAMESWLGGVRGSLAICTVTAATIFAAATGFTGTGTAAFGPVALPQMAKRNYDPGISAGAMGAGSALGVLIPPSVPLLMYGMLSGESVGKLFYGGLVPGIIGSLLFIGYIYARATINPQLFPPGDQVVGRHSRVTGTWRILPLFILIFVVLGSLWGGMATPTEASALGALGAFVMLILYKRFSLTNLKRIIMRTVEINTMVLAIIIGAFSFMQILSYTGFVTNFSASVAALSVPSWFIIVLMMCTNLFLGCFLDTMSIFFLTLPIYLPVVRALGYDLTWFGVLMTINAEIGCLTPPVGINLYILKGVSPPEWGMSSILKGVAPFWVLYLMLMIIVALVPKIVLWLPNVMM